MRSLQLLALLVAAITIVVQPQGANAQSSYNGTFTIIRDPSTCKGITLTSSPEVDPSAAAMANDTSSCQIINWTQISIMKAYTTFQTEDNVEVEARIGPLFVKNSDERLDYECPPDLYNGFDYQFSFCKVVDNSTMMAVAYVTVETNELIGLDAILSGKPFPESLEVNKPPFGAARFMFGSAIPMQDTGSLILCDDANATSVMCDGVVEDQKLDLEGLVFEARGIFSLMGVGYTDTSLWIHDDNRQLLYLTAGQAQGFWFNDSGYFLADYQTQSCSWFSNCNFACEVYNYDSRFLDFIGIWNMTGKHGIDDFEPQEVRVYLGNAIDAAGVFPSLMYISIDEGYYLGLDKLDTTVGTHGSSFWYSETSNATPVFEDYPLAPFCNDTTEQFLTPRDPTPAPTPSVIPPPTPTDNDSGALGVVPNKWHWLSTWALLSVAGGWVGIV